MLPAFIVVMLWHIYTLVATLKMLVSVVIDIVVLLCLTPMVTALNTRWKDIVGSTLSWRSS